MFSDRWLDSYLQYRTAENEPVYFIDQDKRTLKYVLLRQAQCQGYWLQGYTEDQEPDSQNSNKLPVFGVHLPVDEALVVVGANWNSKISRHANVGLRMLLEGNTEYVRSLTFE